MAVLAYEDKVIIKYLRTKFKHGAKRIVADHPEKDWKVATLNDLISKIDTTGDIDRKPGSGRPKSAWTDRNIDFVRELICSQDDAPGTHLTPAEIILHIDTASESSVRRIIKGDPPSVPSLPSPPPHPLALLPFYPFQFLITPSSSTSSSFK